MVSLLLTTIADGEIDRGSMDQVWYPELQLHQSCNLINKGYVMVSLTYVFATERVETRL